MQPNPFEVSTRLTIKATWVDRVLESSPRAPSISSDDDSIDDNSFDEKIWAKWKKEASESPRSTTWLQDESLVFSFNCMAC